MLTISSCQAEVAEPFCAALAEYIGEKLATRCAFVGDIPWQERERLLFRGDIDVCWICGLAYVRRNDQQEILELLAAPVGKHPRYRGMPVYYSDVIVHADSAFRSFGDLGGKTCAYNEPGSH